MKKETMIEPKPSRKKVITSAVCSGLRYASLAALSGVFLVASVNGQLKDVAMPMVSPHKFWMPATQKLAQAFSFICLGFGAASIAETFAKIAKNCSISKPKAGEKVRERTNKEKAVVAVKTMANLGNAVISSAAAYYSFKFVGLFAKAMIAAKNSHFMAALKTSGRALNMSSVFSKLFAWVGVAHAAKGLFKTSATALKYVFRRGQENRPSAKKLAKQSIKTSLKITAAIGGFLCACVPVIGWSLLAASSVILTAWSFSKIWRSKKEAKNVESVQAHVQNNENKVQKAQVTTSESSISLNSQDEPVDSANAQSANDAQVTQPAQKPVKLAKTHRVQGAFFNSAIHVQAPIPGVAPICVA